MSFTARPAVPARPAARWLAPVRLAPALTAAIAFALAGCGPNATSPAGQPSAGTLGAGSPAAAGAGTPGAGCSSDYCVPADWDTAPASTPLAQIPPFTEPLNVVISARSTVPLTAIQGALGDWSTVSATTVVSVTGIRLRCISAERANVAGTGFTAEQRSWRLGGCVGGNELSLSGNEEHVRFWHQPVPGSRYGAWFAAASYETMCVARNGRLRTVRGSEVWAALHPQDAYHCVDGGPGSFRAAHPDGYDDSARDFAAAVTAAARKQGWQVSERITAVPRTGHAGEGGVPFSDDLYILTVRS